MGRNGFINLLQGKFHWNGVHQRKVGLKLTLMERQRETQVPKGRVVLQNIGKEIALFGVCKSWLQALIMKLKQRQRSSK